jgi:hypothetical protein
MLQFMCNNKLVWITPNTTATKSNDQARTHDDGVDDDEELELEEDLWWWW